MRDVTFKLISRTRSSDNHVSGGSGRPASKIQLRSPRASLPQMAQRPIRDAFTLAALKTIATAACQRLTTNRVARLHGGQHL